MCMVLIQVVWVVDVTNNKPKSRTQSALFTGLTEVMNIDDLSTVLSAGDVIGQIWVKYRQIPHAD